MYVCIMHVSVGRPDHGADQLVICHHHHYYQYHDHLHHRVSYL